jgi:hypothetical protein
VVFWGAVNTSPVHQQRWPSHIGEVGRGGFGGTFWRGKQGDASRSTRRGRWPSAQQHTQSGSLSLPSMNVIFFGRWLFSLLCLVGESGARGRWTGVADAGTELRSGEGRGRHGRKSIRYVCAPAARLRAKAWALGRVDQADARYVVRGGRV